MIVLCIRLALSVLTSQNNSSIQKCFCISSQSTKPPRGRQQFGPLIGNSHTAAVAATTAADVTAAAAA